MQSGRGQAANLKPSLKAQSGRGQAANLKPSLKAQSGRGQAANLKPSLEAQSGRGQAATCGPHPTRTERAPAGPKPSTWIRVGPQIILGPGTCGGALRFWLGLVVVWSLAPFPTAL